MRCNACRGFAERRLGRFSFPIEPRNTWSNAVFVLVGWLVWAAAPSPEAVVNAVAMTWLGFGSGGYHGFGGPRWQRADWSGMYAVTGEMTAWLLLAPFASELPAPLWLIMAGGGLVSAVALPWRLEQVGKNGLLALLMVLSLVPAYVNGDARLTLAALGVFALAKVAWLLDWHTEYAGYWGHAAWHVFAAIAFGLLFLAGAA